jgi:hypothetical protein
MYKQQCKITCDASVTSTEVTVSVLAETAITAL